MRPRKRRRCTTSISRPWRRTPRARACGGACSDSRRLAAPARQPLQPGELAAHPWQGDVVVDQVDRLVRLVLLDALLLEQVLEDRARARLAHVARLVEHLEGVAAGAQLERRAGAVLGRL